MPDKSLIASISAEIHYPLCLVCYDGVLEIYEDPEGSYCSDWDRALIDFGLPVLEDLLKLGFKKCSHGFDISYKISVTDGQMRDLYQYLVDQGHYVGYRLVEGAMENNDARIKFLKPDGTEYTEEDKNSAFLEYSSIPIDVDKYTRHDGYNTSDIYDSFHRKTFITDENGRVYIIANSVLADNSHLVTRVLPSAVKIEMDD